MPRLSRSPHRRRSGGPNTSTASGRCVVPPPDVATRAATPAAPAEDPESEAADVAVAEKFAPILRYDSDERLVPVDRAAYVGYANLLAVYWCRQEGVIDRIHAYRRTLKQQPALEDIPQEPLACPAGAYVACHYDLRLRDVPIAGKVKSYLGLQDVLLGGRPPVVYWHVDRTARTAQYWFFDAFNPFHNKHQGDWEQITIQLDPDMREATLVGYSSHRSGQSRTWRDLADGTGREGTHVVVYVARSSHANYFTRGSHRAPECGPFRCDRSDGKGLALTPDTYQLQELKPPIYAGDYGVGNFLFTRYVALGKTKINVSDPQTRDPAWKRPADWLARTARLKPARR